MRLIVFFLFFALFFSLGCRRDSQEASGPVDVLNIPGETVLVSLKSGDVIVADFRQRFELETAIFQRRKGKSPNFSALRRDFRRKRFPTVLSQVVNFKLIRRYLDENNVKPDESAEKKVLRQALASFDSKGDLNGLAESLGVEAAYLRGQLLFPVWSKQAYAHFDPQSAVVSEKEIDEGLERLARYYDRAVASNRVAWAACSNVLAKVRGGMDFVIAGNKFGQYAVREATSWETFTSAEIEAAPLRKWAFSAPVGSVGGPFELDDGLSIVKILGREDGTLEDSFASAKVAEVHLARITFYLVVEEPEPRTREHVREALLDWKAKRAAEALMEKLYEEAGISYPRGTDFMLKEEEK